MAIAPAVLATIESTSLLTNSSGFEGLAEWDTVSIAVTLESLSPQMPKMMLDGKHLNLGFEC